MTNEQRARIEAAIARGKAAIAEMRAAQRELDGALCALSATVSPEAEPAFPSLARCPIPAGTEPL